MASRPLTAGEIALAQQIYGNSIDYSQVRIHDQQHWMITSKTRASAPNGNIYYPPGSDSYSNITDLSAGTFSDKATFIHEMAHVWQHQNGVDVPRTAMDNNVGNYNYNDVFSGKDFWSLGLEQQAQFLRDYYILKNNGTAPGISHTLQEYEDALPDDFADNPNFDDDVYVMQGEQVGPYGPGGNGGNESPDPEDMDDDQDAGDTDTYADDAEDAITEAENKASPLVLDWSTPNLESRI